MSKFCFNFMPYGLKVGPTIFQRLMDKILRGAHSYAAAHLDDIACWSMTWDQHLVHLRQIFTRLRNAGLTLNTNKCRWAMERVHCLGHVLDGGKILPDEEKIKAIKDLKPARTKRAVELCWGSLIITVIIFPTWRREFIRLRIYCPRADRTRLFELTVTRGRWTKSKLYCQQNQP